MRLVVFPNWRDLVYDSGVKLYLAYWVEVALVVKVIILIILRFVLPSMPEHTWVSALPKIFHPDHWPVKGLELNVYFGAVVFALLCVMYLNAKKLVDPDNLQTGTRYELEFN
jgi:hypothetical protein